MPRSMAGSKRVESQTRQFMIKAPGQSIALWAAKAASQPSGGEIVGDPASGGKAGFWRSHHLLRGREIALAATGLDASSWNDHPSPPFTFTCRRIAPSVRSA